MDLRSIRYFVQIADLGSISRAADHLGVAQPALSRHVKGIEDELGMPLLVRLPRGVRLTAPGRQFLEHCRRILRELARAREELRSDDRAPKGKVILGVSPTIGSLLVPGIIERVRRQSPDVSIKVVEAFSPQLYDALLAGKVDVAVLTNPAPSRSVKYSPLVSEPLVVLTPPQQRGTHRYYTLAELARTPIIITSGIRAVIEEQIGRHGGRLNVEAEVDAVEAIRGMLLRGIGTTVMPVSTFHDDIRAGRIAAFPITDASLHRILVLAHLAEGGMSAAAEEVSQLLAAEVDALRERGVFNVAAAPAEDFPEKPAVNRRRK
jgi:DNA-binding transcriptional LysR family regulator